MKIINQSVIVFGVSHPTTLQVIRSIGRANVRVFLVSIGNKTDDILHCSKYVDGYVIYDNYSDGVEFLIEAECSHKKPVIFVSGDDAALAIDDQKVVLSSKYHIPYSSKYSLDYLMKKDVMNEMASKVGINVPKSVLLCKNEPNPLSFPLLLKPLVSVDGTKSDIQICNNQNELINYWENSKLNRVLATEFIEKDYEVCILCAKTSNNPTIIPGVVKKMRHMPLIYGARSYARILKCSSLPMIPYDKICKLIDNTEFSGLLSIELLIKDNNSWFVELNYRADGNMMAYTDAGCNLPYNYYIDTTESSLGNVKNSKIINRELFIMTEGDIYHVIKYRDISLFKWLFDLFHTRSFIVFDFYDLKPFIKYKFYDLKRRILAKIKK